MSWHDWCMYNERMIEKKRRYAFVMNSGTWNMVAWSHDSKHCMYRIVSDFPLTNKQIDAMTRRMGILPQIDEIISIKPKTKLSKAVLEIRTVW